MATDYVLAAMGVWFAVRAWALSRRLRQQSVGWWGWAFFAMAVGAAAGAYPSAGVQQSAYPNQYMAGGSQAGAGRHPGVEHAR